MRKQTGPVLKIYIAWSSTRGYNCLYTAWPAFEQAMQNIPGGSTLLSQSRLATQEELEAVPPPPAPPLMGFYWDSLRTQAACAGDVITCPKSSDPTAVCCQDMVATTLQMPGGGTGDWQFIPRYQYNIQCGGSSAGESFWVIGPMPSATQIAALQQQGINIVDPANWPPKPPNSS